MPEPKCGMPAHAVAVWIAAAASLAALPAPADGPREVRFADGRARFERGALRLDVGGVEVWSKAVKAAPPGIEPDLTVHELAGGVSAIDVRFRGEGGETVFEIVALRTAGERKLRLIWSGSTAASGDPGERARDAVRFEDLTSDGAAEIVIGRAFEPVRLCGQSEPPLLFRRAYDPKSGKFRDILAKRPGIAPQEDVFGTVGPSGELPVVAVIAAEGASRTMGDGRDTLMLAPPQALVDGDPSTVWLPGGGASLGEFATLSAAAEQYGVVRIGVARPARGGKPAFSAPTSMLLVAAKAVYRLRFPERPGGAADVVWFDLPAPLRTACLSLVVEGAEPGASSAQLALGEVVAFTELDREGGLERLARDLGAAATGERAAALLRRAGEKALGPIREAWPKLGRAARRRAVRVVADVAPAKGAPLLAEAAVDRDEIAAAEASAALVRVPEAAGAALTPFLSSADEGRFGGAARTLAAIRAPLAMDALCSAAGKGGRSRRVVVRREIARLSGAGPALAARLAENLVRAAEGADGEVTMDLLRASTGAGGVPPTALALALETAAPGRKFEDRFRALEVVGASREPAALSLLLETAADADAKLRAEAVGRLSAFAADERAARALVAATADAEVPVRLEALAGLRGTEALGRASDGIAALAADDEWPVVRAAAVKLAPGLPENAAVEVIDRASRDPSPDVRGNALAAASRVPGPRLDAIVADRIADDVELPTVRAAGALAARARCQESAAEPLFALLQKGAEPLAERRDVEAAVAAAGALGAIGGSRAVELLRKARQRSNPATDAAIDAALKNPGAECGRGESK